MSIDLDLSLDTLIAWKRKPHAMVEDLFAVRPDPWQRDALEAFPHSPRMAMKACAGPGKTTLLAWLGWNFLLTRPHPKIDSAVMATVFATLVLVIVEFDGERLVDRGDRSANDYRTTGGVAL
jgi:hypothetical protein